MTAAGAFEKVTTRACSTASRGQIMVRHFLRFSRTQRSSGIALQIGRRGEAR
jgi:hypothetical protein